MNLIEAFNNNLIIDKKPDKIIETIVSRIYFYGDKVCKVYKYEKFFFGDFSSPDFRKKFYKEDFYWNNVMAPDIYLNLKIVNLPPAEDFYIEMKKFDDSKNLTNLLLQKNISDTDIEKIISEMIARLNEITINKKNDPDYNFNREFIDIHLADLESDANLLYLIPSFITKEKTDTIINFLKNISLKSSYFKNYDASKFSALIDNHADNIIFLDGRAEFIDVLPPKESWRIGDICFVVSRIATDMAVLWSKEKADILYDIYEKNNKPIIPLEIRAIYEIRSALIQMWCFYSQNKLSIAQKYLKFAEEKISFLKNK